MPKTAPQPELLERATLLQGQASLIRLATESLSTLFAQGISLEFEKINARLQLLSAVLIDPADR
jgi:hypothetical protein